MFIVGDTYIYLGNTGIMNTIFFSSKYEKIYLLTKYFCNNSNNFSFYDKSYEVNIDLNIKKQVRI